MRVRESTMSPRLCSHSNTVKIRLGPFLTEDSVLISGDNSIT